MKYTPHKYQLAAVKFVVGLGCAGLFLDPGLGKTSIMLAAFKILKKMGLVRSMLVIAPLRPMQSTWPAEVRKWDDFNDLKLVILHGPWKDRALRAKADIYVINPEGLGWLERFAPRDPWPFDMLVVDESTRFKHADTQRFKTIKKLLNLFRRRYILTGSPAPNGLLDLFGQIYILDGGNALGRFITHYRMNFFDPTGFGGYTWLPRRGAEEAIYKKLKPLVLRMSAQDYLELPELIDDDRTRVEVTLPAAAMRQYKQMEDLLITTLEEEVVTAANASVAWGKCRQIANGGIYHEGGEEWTHLHEEKLNAVEEIVEELQGKPCLIAYEYKHDLDRLRKRFGEDTPYIGGGVSAARFREIEQAWNRGELPILLAQPQSVAHGLNLQETHGAVIYMGLTPNLEDDEQLIRRVWRQGQKERVFVYRIVAKGTVDEVIIQMLKRKDRTQKSLLNALKDHLKTRRAA
jgi:SNF2 family DNA or RNA helicase